MAITTIMFSLPIELNMTEEDVILIKSIREEKMQMVTAMFKNMGYQANSLITQNSCYLMIRGNKVTPEIWAELGLVGQL